MRPIVDIVELFLIATQKFSTEPPSAKTRGEMQRSTKELQSKEKVQSFKKLLLQHSFIA